MGMTRQYAKKPGRTLNQAPLDPDRVTRIVLLRDSDKLSFKEISETFADTSRPLTRMGVWYAYTRWRPWVIQQARGAAHGRGSLGLD